MGIVTVPMYRAECDQEDCKASPQEDSEFYAWAEPDQTLIEAEDSDWYVSRNRADGEVVLYCPDHRPRCKDEDCGMWLRDDEFGEFCEDHAPEEAVSG